jgi:hypothetical protein
MNRNKLLTTGEKLSWKSIPSKYPSATSHALDLSYFTMSDFIKGDSSNTASLSMMILWVVGSHSLHPLTSSPYQRSTCLIWVLLRMLIKQPMVTELPDSTTTYVHNYCCNLALLNMPIRSQLPCNTFQVPWI